MKKEPCGYRNVYKRQNGTQYLGRTMSDRRICDIVASDHIGMGTQFYSAIRRIGVLHIYSKEQ